MKRVRPFWHCRFSRAVKRPANARRVPPPWSVEELDACFTRLGQAVAVTIWKALYAGLVLKLLSLRGGGAYRCVAGENVNLPVSLAVLALSVALLFFVRRRNGEVHSIFRKSPWIVGHDNIVAVRCWSHGRRHKSEFPALEIEPSPLPAALVCRGARDRALPSEITTARRSPMSISRRSPGASTRRR